jgi:hypothetical protein
MDPAVWTIRYPPVEKPELARSGELPGVYDLCKNCVAERVLTESA